MPEDYQSAEAIIQELDRILASPGFARSPSLRRFLRYTVDLTIQGRQDEIKEYLIGTAVFNRGSAFDPKADTIVRTQAHRLRSALAAYYDTEGQADPIVVEYARGAYVPVFRRKADVEVRAPAERRSVTLTEHGRAAKPKFPWVPVAWLGAALVLMAIAWKLSSRTPAAPSPPPPPVLLSLRLFAPGSLDFDRGTAILSPKGQFVVFPLIETSGIRRLWIRSLKSSSSRPLEGTTGGSLPFWSPDETRIGFFANNMLKVYRLADGSVREISETPMGRGGAWNRDDTILFARQSSGPIFRVSASGGPAAPVTTLNAALEENDHRWPEVLPDGRHFIYSVRARRRANDGIYLASLDGGNPVRLTPVGSQAHYAKVGADHLLVYIDNGSVKVRRLDLRAHKLFGPEANLADGVRYSHSSGAAFSLAGEYALSFYSFTAENAELLKCDRAGHLLQRLTQPGTYKGINLSRDGSQLAIEFTGDPRSGDEILVADAFRPSPLRLTFSSGSYPVWAPDGRSVYYVDFSQGLPVLRHKSLNEEGNGAIIWKPGYAIYPTDCSSDGRFLAYHEDNPRTLMDLYLLPLDPKTGSTAGKPIALRRTPFDESHGFFSPDGRYLAYVSNESGRPEIYVQELPADRPQEARHWKVSSNGGSHPRWRRDGKELFYLSPEKSLMTVRVGSTREGPAFDTPVKLFETLAFSGADSKSPYGVAPDGQSFYFNMIRVDPALPVVNVLTSWPSLIPTH